MNSTKRTLLGLAVAAALGTAGVANASDTSSALRGKILTPDGEAAANVAITVIHESTGTVNSYVTNEAGIFLAKGLRVGGPYKVIIDSEQYQDVTKDGIFLSLGQTARINQQLESVTMESIQVTASRYVQESGGSSSVFNEDTIRNTPSFDKDVKDIARINPLVSIRGNGEMTIAGGNPRTNSFSVDGISQNDDFGLNFGGYPTQQPPVSLSALEQVSVDTSPFSAKKGKFGGGSINAVTKSGTNDFKFSGYYETTTPSLSGDILSISEVRNGIDEDGHRTYEINENEANLTEKRFGFNVGGALIEDELFFFVDYTNWKETSDIDYGFAGSGASNEFNVTAEQFETFNRVLSEKYGLTDALPTSPEDTDESILTKLSWNINDDHRMDFTYQWKEGVNDSNVSGGGSTVKLNSTRYDYVTKFDNYSTKLYSDWSDDFSTEIGLSYKNVTNTSDTNSDIGTVRVYLDGGRGDGFEFGRDVNRHANESETETFILSLDATYFMGEHEITFGGQFERLSLYNLYVRDSKGSWTFQSLEDFENQTLNADSRGTTRFTYSNAYTNNVADGGYTAVRSQLSLYAQDKFYLTDELEVTAGLRYERLIASDKATLNEDFQSRYGFSNQENLDGLDIFLPRLGLVWTPTEDLTVRGGIGRFQGGSPNVWFNNPFTYDGVTVVSAFQSDINDYFENNRTVTNFDVPQGIKDTLQQGQGWVAYNDPNFKMPSSWRAQVGFDLNFDIPMLGNDFKWTNEAIYKVDTDQAVWLNTSLRQVGVAADGERIINEPTRGDLYDIMMTNADDDPKSLILTTALAKQWDNGIRMTMSYTNQDIEDVHAGSASNTDSNYKHSIVVNRNQIEAARGNYEVKHSLKLTLGYTTELFAGYQTRFNTYFERRSGRPFSYTMGMFRDGDLGDNREFNSTQAYLPYIPTGPNDANVNWDESRITWSELEVLLDRAGITERGEILGRNTATQPWVTTMDVSVHQEIPGFAEGHKGEVYFMIDNFVNLLNDDWGIERDMRFFNKTIYDFGGLDDQGRYILDAPFRGADVRNYNQIDRASSWQIKVGVSYKF